ncbi:MAG: amidohydrolase [Actinobacteria bacterium]|nr:amidohydrolase [Actinomycetota bacterium]
MILKNLRTFNEQTEQFQFTDIRIDDGLIKEVTDNLQPKPSEQVHDYNGRIALPGFIDAHTHLTQTFARGLLDDLPLTLWLEKIWTYHLDDEASYYSTLLGCLEAIRTGTTTVSEMLTEKNDNYDLVVQAILDSGLRANLGLAIGDHKEGENTPVATTDECLEKTKLLFDRWNSAGSGRLKVVVAPVGLPACTAELMRQSCKLAKNLGTGIHAHACEGLLQTKEIYRRYGCGEIEALHKFGLLGNKTELVHVIWLCDLEIDLLASSDTSVVHCPNSNMKLTDGISPVTRMIDRGINVAIGCDGAASNGNYDMLREVRSASMLQKVGSMRADAFPTIYAYHAITKNGAKAIGMKDEIGAIRAGLRADITIIDYPALHLIDGERLLSNLINSGTGYDVSDVFIDGEQLLANKNFTKFDSHEVIAKCEKIMKRVKI